MWSFTIGVGIYSRGLYVRVPTTILGFFKTAKLIIFMEPNLDPFILLIICKARIRHQRVYDD